MTLLLTGAGFKGAGVVLVMFDFVVGTTTLGFGGTYLWLGGAYDLGLETTEDAALF